MKNTKKLFALCYLAAAALWLLYGTFGTGRMLLKQKSGQMQNVLLSADELQMESFIHYSVKEWLVPPDDDPNWYLSTDSDPQLLWEGEAFVENVVLYARHYLPPGSVTLYYRTPGQTDYSEMQKIYASLDGEGVYRFDLDGKEVVGLRIDPDSLGGIPTLFGGVELNAPEPFWKHYLPDGGQVLALLALPALAAALVQLGREALCPEAENQKEE